MAITSLTTPATNKRKVKSRLYRTYRLQWLPWNTTDGFKEKLQVATVTESTWMWDGMDCTTETTPGTLDIDTLAASLLDTGTYPNSIDAWWEPYGNGDMAKLYQSERSIGTFADV